VLIQTPSKIPSKQDLAPVVPLGLEPLLPQNAIDGFDTKRSDCSTCPEKSISVPRGVLQEAFFFYKCCNAFSCWSSKAEKKKKISPKLRMYNGKRSCRNEITDFGPNNKLPKQQMARGFIPSSVL
jgi:hypothetical protein